MEKIKKLYVIFKSHLDIGFTDFSKNVREEYINRYIPLALKTAKELRESGNEARFVWTTGSWLINEYVNTLNADEFNEFKKQVEAGDIRWHGLPFTTHTEIMDAELFETGIGISQELDKTFGLQTVSAKMTDVPGHTRAIVPFLAKAGIEFLHIGVNPASAVPNVPQIFRWKSPTGEAITVMYHSDYGVFSKLGETESAIYFAHAGDNTSPPSAEEIIKLFNDLHEKYPDAEIIASDLNAPAYELRSEIDKLPIITDEIGDSWIHGAGTDPAKINMFRALLRFGKDIKDFSVRKQFDRELLLISEHTWGLDEKTHLNDHENFSKESFNSVRSSEPYQKMEQSWREQRAYLEKALSILPRELYSKAKMVVEETKRVSVLADICSCSEVPADTVFHTRGIEFSFGLNGAINKLIQNGKVYADENHNFGIWSYTQFGPEDYKRFFKQYVRSKKRWALEDFNKIGFENYISQRHDYVAKLEKVLVKGDMVTAIVSIDSEANIKFGCPKWMETTVIPTEKGLIIDAAWFGKPANRAPEMINFGFEFCEKDLETRKLGEWLKPDVVDNGSKNMFATDFGVRYPSITIHSVDGAVASIGKPAMLDFQNEFWDRSKIWFNLYNNQWGTNFPMWYEEDARFRYELIFMDSM